MELVLWGRANSANVQKTLWALEELGLAYEHRPLGGSFGGLDAPDYLAMNPNGLVPTLQDGTLTVWESHATVRYLAAAYGSGLIWPIEPKTRALCDQWADWTATTFQPAWLKAFWLVVRTPVDQHDAEAIDTSVKAANRCIAMLNDTLADRNFLTGEFSYADIVAGVALYRWFTMDVSRAPVANVEAWYARLQERPAFRKAVMVSYEDLVGRLAF